MVDESEPAVFGILTIENLDRMLRERAAAGDADAVVTLALIQMAARVQVMHARAQQAESRAKKAEEMLDRYAGGELLPEPEPAAAVHVEVPVSITPRGPAERRRERVQAQARLIAELVVRCLNPDDPICAPFDGMPAAPEARPPHHSGCACVMVGGRR